MSRLGTMLLLASVVLWVCNAELLQSAHSVLWDKPYAQVAAPQPPRIRSAAAPQPLHVAAP